MIAGYESSACTDFGHTSLHKYKNLHNLPHWHTEHEVICVMSGTARLNINNKAFSLSENMCAFVNGHKKWENSKNAIVDTSFVL